MADPDEETLTVYVPTEDSELQDIIADGSAIVGSQYRHTGRLRIDFEGNLYNLDGLHEFESKLQRAAERHLANEGRGAETVACAYIDQKEVVAVGQYDVQTRKIAIHHADRLNNWLGRNDSSDILSD